MLADHGEFILAQCDQMRVALSNDGVVLTSVEPRSLAGVLGLDVGDVIVQINEISTLDVAALLVEFDRIRTRGGPATIEYRGSDGNSARIELNVL